MNIQQTLEYIEATCAQGSVLGLDTIRNLMKLLGNPQDRLKFVHVAGTNGKGSTSAFISSILIAAGNKTGMFTSPHVERFSERFVIDNKEISDEDISPVIEKVKSAIDKMMAEGMTLPTEFEIICAMAFVYFELKKCDIVVLEVGLGGRLDSTNIIKSPLLAVITTIDYDHMKELGESLREIATEKCGIIKPHCKVVSYDQQEECRDTIQEICKERDAELYFADTDNIEIFNYEKPEFSLDCYKNLRISLLGEHQFRNAALAVKAVQVLRKNGYQTSEDAIRQGLLAARWKGRFEILRTSPLVIVDGAHNQQGASVLADNLKRFFPDKSILFIVGILGDKAYLQMLKPNIEIASRFLTVTPNSPRALSAKDLAEVLKSNGAEAQPFDDVGAAIKQAVETVAENEVICIFGSLYLIGEVRALLGRED